MEVNPKEKKQHQDSQKPHQASRNQETATTCTKCNKPGHTSNDCWAGKTFPPCGFCALTNHPRQDCWKEKQYKARQQRQQSNSGPQASFLCETVNVSVCNPAQIFLADSGCSTHMVNNRESLKNIRPSNKTLIKTANKEGSLLSEEKGDVHSDKVVLSNVSYVPDLSRSLLSINAVTNRGGEVLFTKESVKIYNAGSVEEKSDPIIEGWKNSTGLYEVHLGDTEETMMAEKVKQETLEWHRKMGHINFQTCGKITPPTFDGKNYMMTVRDDYTHFTKVYLLERKNEAEKYLHEFVQEGEANFNIKTKKIRLDNGGEYISNNFKNWCKNKGIVLDYIPPGTKWKV